MPKLLDSLHILWCFRAVVEAINPVDIHQSTSVGGGHQGMAAHGGSKAVADKDRILDSVGVQHTIDGSGEEVESVVCHRFIALSVAGQVDKHLLHILVAKSLELLLPSVHVAPESVNKAKGLNLRVGSFVPYLVVYFDPIVNGNILRLDIAERLWPVATTNQQHGE